MRANTSQRSWDNYTGGNTSQRSWDNYTGSNPIKSWAAQGFYNNSGGGGSSGDGEKGKMKRRKKSEVKANTSSFDDKWDAKQEEESEFEKLERKAEMDAKQEEESEFEKLQRRAKNRRLLPAALENMTSSGGDMFRTA